ncbi:hypothetical protein VTK73DRAFT_10261 [Phialemonium thermophilum]|uniref:C2H2-type domain-containing protein n=1 Tax=Phialemonium thermophilum TaxID=223376 RepID=A0ABR3VXK3_9PEZI
MSPSPLVTEPSQPPPEAAARDDQATSLVLPLDNGSITPSAGGLGANGQAPTRPVIKMKRTGKPGLLRPDLESPNSHVPGSASPTNTTHRTTPSKSPLSATAPSRAVSPAPAGRSKDVINKISTKPGPTFSEASRAGEIIVVGSSPPPAVQSDRGQPSPEKEPVNVKNESEGEALGDVAPAPSENPVVPPPALQGRLAPSDQSERGQSMAEYIARNPRASFHLYKERQRLASQESAADSLAQSGIQPILTTVSGRPYTRLLDKEHGMISGRGALFPDDYKTDHTNPKKQWICPIRACRRHCPSVNRLGSHFKKSHWSCLLHDELDGTFSIVGTYEGTQGALVVSRQPGQRKQGGFAIPSTPRLVTESRQGPSSQLPMSSADLSASDDEHLRSDISLSDAGPVLQSDYADTPTRPDSFDTSADPMETDGLQPPYPVTDSSAPHARPFRTGRAGRPRSTPRLRREQFQRTPSGRMYTMYPDASGNLVSTLGVPIPDGYDRWVKPQHPWHCPVRSCPALLDTKLGLGIHFGRKHRGACLNDNLDGTLSEVSYDHTSVDPVTGHKVPAIVVSRNPINTQGAAGESGVRGGARGNRGQEVRTRLATDLERKRKASSEAATLHHPRSLETLEITQQQKDPARRVGSYHATAVSSVLESLTSSGVSPEDHTTRSPTEVVAEDPQNPNGPKQGDLWDVARPYASEMFPTGPPRFARVLLVLPQVRDLAWNEIFLKQRPPYCRGPNEVAAMLIQLTGDKPLRPCAPCAAASGSPYRECIVVSRAADFATKSQFVGCANCLYNEKTHMCRWEPRPGENASSQNDPPTGVEETQVVHAPNGRVIAKKSDVPSLEGGPLHEGHPDGRYARADRVQPESIEMEEWEVAPGRVRSSSARYDDQEVPENIAYSKAYLTNQAVRVGGGLSFRVAVVSSGASIRWESASARTRICSVAEGKVRVRMEGEQEFSIGRHGMFKVPGNRSCVISNRFYADAVLHINEFPDDLLLE